MAVADKQGGVPVCKLLSRVRVMASATRALSICLT